MKITDDPINSGKISRAVDQFKEIVNHDCFSKADEVRDIFMNLNYNEQIEFNNRLKRITCPKKNGSGVRQLNTLLREYLMHYE